MNSLVSCGWVHNVIRGSAGKIRVLEASWAAKGAGLESFKEQHVPSAHFYDMWRGCTPTQERPRALHDPASFEEYAQLLGINNDSHIVIYDKGPIYFAARLWFQFKAFGHDNVSVVDGGMMKWLQENLPVESGDVSPPEVGNFKIRSSNMHQFISLDEFLKARDSKCQIIDTRMAEHFRGESQEPNFGTLLGFEGVDFDLPSHIYSGHVPGSLNLCYLMLNEGETGAFLPQQQLVKLFEEAGYDPSQPLTGLCYSGMSACILALARTKLDVPATPVHVYAGSWTEYGQKVSEKDVEVGPAKL